MNFDFLKKMSKNTRLLVIGVSGIVTVLFVVALVHKYIGTTVTKHEVKVYENMAENYLADQVRTYIKSNSNMNEEEIDTVADVAVQDYNTVLNSGVSNVTDEHTKALEDSIRDALGASVLSTQLTEEELDYLSNGVCQLIWNALLEELEKSELLVQEYEEQYFELTGSLQAQIDELAERSTAISITANIKKDNDGIGVEELESAKTDIYDNVSSEMYSELESMKEEIKTEVMNSVSDGKDGKDGVGIAGKDGSDGKDGINAYTHIRYSASSNGEGMTDKPQADSVYIGIYNGTEKEAPTDKNKYVWSKYQGKDGATGKSAYQSAVDTGSAVGMTEKEWIESLGGDGNVMVERWDEETQSLYLVPIE